MRQLFIVTITALLLAGCATIGAPFPSEHVEQLEVGKTSRAEVRDMFGAPWRTGLEDGQPTWTYGNYRWSAFGEDRTEDLVVRFDGDGVVRSYTYNTTE